MPDETLTLSQLKGEVSSLLQLLNDPAPRDISYHLAVARKMDALVELWGDRYTPPVGVAPSTYEGLVGKMVPGAPNQSLEVMRIGDETVLINDEDTIVMSKSNAGLRYHVTIAHCECSGYQFRGTCRHIAAATEARKQYRKEAYERSKEQPS
jgi:hypothetical protein